MRTIAIILGITLFLMSCNTTSSNDKQGKTKKASSQAATPPKPGEIVVERNPERMENAEKVLLRFNPKVGSKKYMTMKMITDVMGQSSEITMVMSQKFNKISNNGEVDSEVRYTDFTMDMMGRKISLDDSPELQAIAKSKANIRFNDRGEILDVKSDNRELANQIKQTSSSMFMATYPKQELFIGDRWKTNQTMATGGMEGDFISTYTLKEINDKTIIIDMKSNGKGTSSSVKVAFDLSGTLTVDRATGYPLKAHILQNFKIPQGKGTNTISITVD
jgi:hypothetical protein